MTSYYYSCGFRVFFSADQSLYFLINPKMKDHFFIDESILKKNSISSASFLVVRSLPSLTIIEDMVKCSLTESCMDFLDENEVNLPKSNNINNSPKNDDSLLSLTLAECSRDSNYYLGPSELVVKENVKGYDWRKLKREYPVVN